MTASPRELSAALANEIVALMADYTGRGSPKSRCYVHENLIVCVLHDSLTKGELSLVNDGKEEAVLAIRRTYQESMRTELIEIVERLTGRKVSAFMSSNHVNPDVAIESFVLELRDTTAPNQATPQPNDRPVETS
ncbi:MAG: Na-translocating system protein MpsC family protein [Solirubrobacteraceae bacterium]